MTKENLYDVTEYPRVLYAIDLIATYFFDLSQHKQHLIESQNSCDRAAILLESSSDPQSYQWTTDEVPKLLLQNQHGTFIWDPLAAIFFLSSGYEYYNTELLYDRHGRILEQELSIVSSKNHHLALCHHWALQFLQQHEITPKKHHFSAELQIDVDMPWAFRHKAPLRAWGGFFRDIINREFEVACNRIRVLLGRREDPFDTYRSIQTLAASYQVPLRFFFPVDNTSFYDKNPILDHKAYKKLILTLASQSDIALHPSYDSSDQPTLFREQQQALSTLTQQEIEHSRQHFLRLRWPSSFQELYKAGIKHEYSLGFSTEIGFKTGICVPYPWFDISENKSTDLLLHPFTIMDVSLNDHLKLSPNDAIQAAKRIIDETKLHCGVTRFVWHNSSFDFQGPYWNGWDAVLPSLLNYTSD